MLAVTPDLDRIRRDTLTAQPSAVASPFRGAHRRVGLVTAHGWVGISTPVLMTARYLAQVGYGVDLFIDEDETCTRLGIALPQFREPNIRPLVFPRQASDPTRPPAPGMTSRDQAFVEHARRLLGAYDWLVGFDPHGLIRAAMLGEAWNVPFIYHSLEIHDAEDDLKQLERRFSKSALVTVTQDEIRAEILAATNRIPRERVAVVYNSSLGEVAPEKHAYFRNKFSIPESSTVVLAAGTLLPHHCIDRIVAAASSWPRGFALVLHGWIPDPGFESALRRRCAADPGRIFLSTDILPAESKAVVFQSADIGLVFYSPDDTNLKYASGSAGKIFDFMQAGVPIIANDLPGMRRLIEENGCGRVVSRVEDIAGMLPAVMQNYAALRAGALQSFGRYGFAASYKALLDRTAPASGEKPLDPPARSGGAGRSADAGFEDADLDVIRSLRPFASQSEPQWQSLCRLGLAVCRENLAGNFVVCGAGSGAAAMLLAHISKRHSRTPRQVFFFHGPPEEPSAGSAPEEGAGARGILPGAGLHPEAADRIVRIPGPLDPWLPAMRGWLGMVALVHLKGGHEYLHHLLSHLHRQFVDGARLQVEWGEDRNHCRQALQEFEAREGLRFDLETVDAHAVRFRYPARLKVNAAISAQLAEEFHLDDPLRCGIESQMSTNERFQLYCAVRRLSAVRGRRLWRFIEIGSYAGASFYLIAKALQRMRVAFQGIAIEPGGQPQFPEVLRRFRDNAVHIPSFSHTAAVRLAQIFDEANPPEFILVDGDHRYPGVRRDILDFYPMLAPGGLMVFHDYLPPLDDRNREFIYAHHAHAEPGIRRACQELMEKAYGLTPLDIPLLYPQDLSQTQAHLPVIPGVASTVRAYRKPPR